MSSPPPNVLPTSPKTRDYVLVRAHVALDHERARDALGEVANALLDPLALERERDLRALLGEPTRDRPRDRAPVGDPEHERLLSLEAALSSSWRPPRRS